MEDKGNRSPIIDHFNVKKQSERLLAYLIPSPVLGKVNQIENFMKNSQ